MIKMVESKIAAIFNMATNSRRNNDILVIIKTMLVSAVIATLCLTVIHLRINLFKKNSDKKLCNPKWSPFLESIVKKAVYFYIVNQL